MSTLLLSHPACLDHLTPPAIPSGRTACAPSSRRWRTNGSRCWRASRRRRRRSRSSRSAHPMDYIEAIRDASPDGRLGAARRRHRRCRRAASRRRLRGAGGAMRAVDEVMNQKAAQRLRRHSPARPPRRDGAADGLLPVQQRGDRGALRAEPLRASSAPRSSISTCITATARRIFSGRTRRVMYCSTHEMPLYPGTGAMSERGEHNTIVNAPLRPAMAATPSARRSRP